MNIIDTSSSQLKYYSNEIMPNTIKGLNWDARINDLLSLYHLKDNWDFDGAEAPSQLAVISAIEYVVQLHNTDIPAPVRITASQDGEIIIEWQINEVYLEAEIYIPYKAEWMAQIPGQPIEHWETLWKPSSEYNETSSNLIQQYNAA